MTRAAEALPLRTYSWIVAVSNAVSFPRSSVYDFTSLKVFVVSRTFSIPAATEAELAFMKASFRFWGPEFRLPKIDPQMAIRPIAIRNVRLTATLRSEKRRVGKEW